MKLADMRIATRLWLLGGLFFIALLAVGLFSWKALAHSGDQGIAALQRAAVLTDAVDSARAAQVDFKVQVQEWKNILLRGSDSEQFDKYKAAFQTKSDATNAQLQRVGTLLGTLGLQTPLLHEALKAHAELDKNYISALEKYDAADPHAHKTVDALVKGMDRAPTKKIDAVVAFLKSESGRMMAGMKEEQELAQRDSARVLAGTAVASLLAAVAFMVWLGRSITRPLHEAVAIARTVASGDLSTDIRVTSSDEIGILLQSLKDMNNSLSGLVGKVRSGTDAIALASSEIADGNQSLSGRTEEQAGSLEETASAMEQLTSAVKQNGSSAQEASMLAATASGIAVRGGAAVRQVVDTMGAIDESARKIVDIISVIDGIAFQTNILALNAAVEAARAGEQGRGFAVVASEVRTLAQRSAAAAKEIKALIGDSVDKVALGSRLAGEAGSTMNEVVASVQRVTAMIAEIAQVSAEQNSGIEQVNQAIAQMDDATQQNAALVEQAAAAAESMREQAGALAHAVSAFRIGQLQGLLPQQASGSEPAAATGARKERFGVAANV
jgi:methyl-accepting chemotaxis protein-1 (serine sensor receptor)